MSAAHPLRVLIWGKTYPELSDHHQETVCTAGVREDGEPIRLYPVRLRYLEGPKRYHLYDVVEVAATRNLKDPRPESFKVRDESITVVDRVPSDRNEWAARREWLSRGAGRWHFRSMDQLMAAQAASGRSLGFMEVGAIDGVSVRAKPPAAAAKHAEKFAAISAQADAFLTEYKQLDFVPVEFHLRWSCADRCTKCRRSPHDMQVLDWGLVQLGRTKGWDAAREKLETLADLGRYDFRLFLGNFRQHLTTFGIVGLWYPRRSAQQQLL